MALRRQSRRSNTGAPIGNAPVVTLDDAPALEGSSRDENENTSLYMECEEEPLSVAQKTDHSKKMKDFLDQMKKLESLASKNTTITEKDGGVLFRTTTDTIASSNVTPVPTVTKTVVQPPMPNRTPNYRLLMDPRTGRILGTINGAGAVQPANPTNSTIIRATAPNVTPLNRLPMSRPQTVLNRTVHSQIQVQRPATTVKPAQVVDLTRSTGPTTTGATSSTSSNPKTKFPALNVQPKPQDVQANLRRPELDQKVKSLLVMTPAKLTEWLIQQGLVPQEQTEYGQKLKLGMYSDSKKFPNSGGYVWLSDDARNRYVSVFKGSLFETIIQPPSVLLKLIYHWVCQTSLNNVLTWVKVDHVTVDTFYRHMRCICVTTVQEEITNLGGSGKSVELGVISLGTTTTDGNRREVKVEVLGILERNTGKMRLRATEPVSGSSQAERFARIFKPLPSWIQRDTRIIADFSVDRERLVNMGYTNVFQCSAGANVKKSEHSNAQIMDYLKKVVPRMFQNSLSVLSTTLIQQFLDELTFREVYGKGPLQCFEGIVQKIAAQTSFATKKNTTMSTRLRTVADSPFGDWRMSNATQLIPGSVSGIDVLPPSIRTSSIQYSGMKRPFEGSSSDIQLAKKPAYTVELESYYYGTIEGDISILVGEFKADMAFKCHLCKKLFMNNIEFMKHLSLHVENDRATAVDLVDLHQCKYCLKDFEDSFSFQKHQDDAHFKTNSSFVCRICSETFLNSNMLISHMMRNHVASELPYCCQVCGFRTSMHREAIDHFTELHDRTDKLQCPRCLKTFSLFGEKGYNSSIAVAFVEHLQSHQDGKRISCKKCCLSFKDDKKLRAHLDRDHGSFRGFDGLEAYQYLANDTPMTIPKPEERGMKMAPKKSSTPKLGQVQQAAFAAQNLEDLAMYDIESDDVCYECGKKFVLQGHFNAYLCCTKCRYSSCCSRALSIHVQLFHGPKTPQFTLGHPSMLPNEVFCVCGFSTKSGNKMAKHLGMNGCRSAYPTKEKAASAAKPILVDRDGEIESFDPNEVMAKAYMSKKPDDDKEEPKSQAQDGPLAFLGLQKKSEEKVDKPVIKKITLEEALSGKAPSPPKDDVVKEKKDDKPIDTPDDKSDDKPSDAPDDKHEKTDDVTEVDEASNTDADESSKVDDKAKEEKLTEDQEKSPETESKPTEEDKVENDKPEIEEDNSTMEKENDSETPEPKDDGSQDDEKSDDVTPMET